MGFHLLPRLLAVAGALVGGPSANAQLLLPLVGGSANGVDAPPTTYSVKELRAPNGFAVCEARALNDADVVVGGCMSPLEWFPVSWQDDVVLNLSPDQAGFASAINAGGDVAGDTYIATRWRIDGRVTSLPSLRGDNVSIAYAIADDGTVVGMSNPSGNGVAHATVWKHHKPKDLGTLGGNYSVGHAVNRLGQIAGESTTEGESASFATIWNSGAISVLPRLNSTFFCSARDINDAGSVVGTCRDLKQMKAVAWVGPEASELPGLSEGDTFALAVNNHGLVVGSSALDASGQRRAVRWWKGILGDLNGFLTDEDRQAGWVLEHASDVNAKGTIVGSGICPGRRQCAFMLTPTNMDGRLR